MPHEGGKSEGAGHAPRNAASVRELLEAVARRSKAAALFHALIPPGTSSCDSVGHLLSAFQTQCAVHHRSRVIAVSLCSLQCRKDCAYASEAANASLLQCQHAPAAEQPMLSNGSGVARPLEVCVHSVLLVGSCDRPKLGSRTLVAPGLAVPKAAQSCAFQYAFAIGRL